MSVDIVIKKFIHTFLHIIIPNMQDKVYYSTKFLSSFYTIELFIFLTWFKEFSYNDDCISLIMKDLLYKYGPNYNLILQHICEDDKNLDCVLFILNNYDIFKVNLENYFNYIYLHKNKISHKIRQESYNFISEQKCDYEGNYIQQKEQTEQTEHSDSCIFDSEYDIEYEPDK